MVNVYLCITGTCYLHLPGRRVNALHIVTYWKTVILKFIAATTSNFKHIVLFPVYL